MYSQFMDIENSGICKKLYAVQEYCTLSCWFLLGDVGNIDRVAFM